MWQNRQETGDLVTFAEEILNGKLHFLCSFICVHTEAYPGFLQAYNMKSFEIVSSQNQLIIVAKRSMLDISGSQWYASVHIYLRIPKDLL